MLKLQSRLPVVSALLMAAVAVSSAAHADPGMLIQVGGGAESSDADNRPVNALVRFTVAYDSGSGGHTFNHVLFGVVEGDLVGGTSQGVVGMDLRIKPISLQATDNVDSYQIDQAGFAINFFPIRITRDVRLNEKLTVRVDVLGVDLSAPIFVLQHADTTEYEGSMENSLLAAYLRIAADAVGYKMASHIAENMPAFHGLHLAQLEAALGVEWTPGSHDDRNDLRVRLEIGGQADLAIGIGGSSSGFGIQSDAKAFARFTVDIQSLLRFFVEGELRASGDTSNRDSATDKRFMAGALLMF